MDEKFIKAVQSLERAAQMQWAEYDWLDAGHSVFAVYDADPDYSDGLMFTIAGNNTPDWAARLNGCNLDTVAKAASLYRVITADEFAAIMEYFN